MAFNSDGVRVNIYPAGNQGPGLVILHDPGSTSAQIANNAFFARGTALATRGDTDKDNAVQKRYAGIAGMVKAGRGRDKTAATDAGGVLIAAGSNDPVMKRLAVSTDAAGADTIRVL